MTLGDRVVLMAGTRVGDGCVIGEDTVLYPNVVFYSRSGWAGAVSFIPTASSARMVLVMSPLAYAEESAQLGGVEDRG